MMTITAPKGQPTDRQRKLADDRAQRVTFILDDLRGQEYLLEPYRRAILKDHLRGALARLEGIGHD